MKQMLMWMALLTGAASAQGVVDTDCPSGPYINIRQPWYYQEFAYSDACIRSGDSPNAITDWYVWVYDPPFPYLSDNGECYVTECLYGFGKTAPSMLRRPTKTADHWRDPVLNSGIPFLLERPHEASRRPVRKELNFTPIRR